MAETEAPLKQGSRGISENPKSRRRPKGFRASLSNLLIGIVLGLLIGIVGTIVIMNHNPEDEQAVTPSVVFDRIVSKDELVCASQSYSITDKSTQNPQRFFDLFDIPFTDTSFWYRYVGTLKVGVNLETARFSQEGGNLTVTLDEPYIVSNTPDMNASGVLETRDNLFAHVQPQDVDEFQRQCIKVSEENAAEGGLFDEARANAESNIASMFQAALGDDYAVTVAWREGEEG